MKTRIIFLLATLLAIVQGVWAQQPYITDVMVLGYDKLEDAQARWAYYEKQGWSINWQDLNKGAGGHYIYLMYKTNESPGSSGTPINEFYLRVAKNGDPALSYYNIQGCRFNMTPRDGDQDFKDAKESPGQVFDSACNK